MHRISVFTGHYHPHMGGVEQYTAALWGRLAERGHRVLIVTGNTNNVAEYENSGPLEILRLPVFNVINGRLPIIKPAPSLARAMGILSRWRPTVVVTNTRFFPICILGRLFAGVKKLPHIHIEHGSEHIKLGSPLTDMAGEVWDHAFGGFVVRNADRCFGVSKSIGAIVGHLGRKQCGVMYNGVDASLFSPGPSSFRDVIKAGKDSFLFLFAGRLIEEKGVRVLVEAFRSLPADAGCELAIAGSGHLDKYVREEALKDPRIHFAGRLARKELLDFLRCGDCFVLPTSYPEGLPTSILEAQAVGLPVIATPKGGNTEAVLGGINGIIVPPEDPQALSSAMSRMASDRESAARMGADARRYAAGNFDWEKIAENMENELQSIGKGAVNGR